jgi:beta-lactamase regulating signal transducer with metallopeptidase domain
MEMSVVWALTWLGQSAAFAALTAACVRLPGCRQSAATRYAAWAAALFLCAGLLAWPLVSAAATAPALRSAPDAAGVQAAGSILLVVLPAPVALVWWWLGWTWALGSAAGLALAARDVWRVVRLKRRTVPLSTEERARLGEGGAASALSRAPRLAWCDELCSPAVLGFSGPVIALPRSQMSCLSDGQFRLVVLHELAHVRRGDDWWALAERVVLALAWVNPAVHWMCRELSLSREMACDEWVVRQTASPVAYAKCLAEVAGLRALERRLRLAAGVNGRPGTLRRRIIGVLELNRPPSARAVAIVAWLAPVAVCVTAAGLLRLPPVFVVAHPPDSVVPAQAWSGPSETADRGSVGWLASPPEAGRPPVPERRASFPHRSSDAPGVPAGAAVIGDATAPAAAPDLAVDHVEELDTRTLAASPLPVAPGVTVASSVPGTFPQPAAAARWWSGPAAIGHATGGAVATAGRKTASFVTRFGSHVPQLLKR